MDEPTAALSAVEVARLFRVVESLRARGAAVLFISHRLEEVFELCQRVTVLRDGRWVLSRELTGLTADDLVRAMVGRDIVAREPEQQTVGDVVLRVERLTREGFFTDVSFEVRAGEIVALAGLVGAGRSEVACSIFGIDRYDAGSVDGERPRTASRLADGGDVAPASASFPRTAVSRASCMDLSISTEHRARVAWATAALRVHLSSSERRFAADWAVRLRLKYGRTRRRCELALRREPAEGRARQVAAGGSRRLLIVDEPTRGIDIGTKAEVHRLLDELAARAWPS